jgi:hypothetical protein
LGLAAAANAQPPHITIALDGGVARVKAEVGPSNPPHADTRSLGIVQVNAIEGVPLLVCAPWVNPGDIVLFDSVEIELPRIGSLAVISARSYDGPDCTGAMRSDSSNFGFLRFADEPSVPALLDSDSPEVPDVVIP